MPLVSDPRDKMANQLLMRGHASVEELLTANYGEWPLRGLEIVTDDHLKQRVSLSPFANHIAQETAHHGTGVLNQFRRASQKATLLRHTGGVAKTWGGEREIWINKFVTRYKNGLLRPMTNATLAHERRHIQQGDFTDAIRAQDTFGASFVRDGLTPANDKGYLIANDIVGGLIHKHETENGATQKFLKTSRKAIDLLNPFALPGPGKGHLGYLKEGIEMQARMEELLVAGYPKWGHMPQNRLELSVAMEAAGLEPPPNVRRTMRKDPDYRAAKAKFKDVSAPGWATKQLNQAIDHLPSKAARTEFWQEAMPALYSDVIETMGDRLGRERMGFGLNSHLPKILFGKDYDALQADRIDPAVNKSVADHVATLGPKLSARFVAALPGLTDESNKASRRLVDAIAQAPGVADEMLLLAKTPDADPIESHALTSIAETAKRQQTFAKQLGVGGEKLLSTAEAAKRLQVFTDQHGEAATHGVIEQSFDRFAQDANFRKAFVEASNNPKLSRGLQNISPISQLTMLQVSLKNGSAQEYSELVKITARQPNVVAEVTGLLARTPDLDASTRASLRQITSRAEQIDAFKGYLGIDREVNLDLADIPARTKGFVSHYGIETTKDMLKEGYDHFGDHPHYQQALNEAAKLPGLENIKQGLAFEAEVKTALRSTGKIESSDAFKPSAPADSETKPPVVAFKLGPVTEADRILPATSANISRNGSLAVAFQQADSHAGKAMGIAGTAFGIVETGIAIKQGDYVAAAQQGTITALGAVAQNESALKAISKIAAKAAPAIFRTGSEEIPIIGGIVAAGFGVWDTGSAAIGAIRGQNSWTKVGTTAVANVAEVGGGLLGFGAGQAARQTVVEGSKLALGAEAAPTDAAIVGLGKEIYQAATAVPGKPTTVPAINEPKSTAPQTASAPPRASMKAELSGQSASTPAEAKPLTVTPLEASAARLPIFADPRKRYAALGPI